MPVHWRIDRGFTIEAGQTQYWNWNFFTDSAPGTGPNQGPIVFPRKGYHKAEIIRSGTCLLLTTLPCAAAVQATTMRQRFSTSLRSGTRVPLLCHLT